MQITHKEEAVLPNAGAKFTQFRLRQYCQLPVSRLTGSHFRDCIYCFIIYTLCNHLPSAWLVPITENNMKYVGPLHMLPYPTDKSLTQIGWVVGQTQSHMMDEVWDMRLHWIITDINHRRHNYVTRTCTHSSLLPNTTYWTQIRLCMIELW